MNKSIYKILNTPILLYTAFIEQEIRTMVSCTTARKFEQDLATMLRLGYQSISLKTLHEQNGLEEDAEQKQFCVVINGGYESAYELAYPVLKKLNVFADFFIPTMLVGMQILPNGQPAVPHFTWKQAEEMVSDALINLHGMWHPFDEGKELSAVISRETKLIQEHFPETNFIAFLHYFNDNASYRAIADAGIQMQMIPYDSLTLENIEFGCTGTVNVNYYIDVMSEIYSNSAYKKSVLLNEMSVGSVEDAIAITESFFSQINKTSIELPVNKNPIVKSMSRHAFPMSVLLSDDEYDFENYVLSDYIQFIGIPLYDIWDFANSHYMKWSCLIYSRIYPDVLKSNGVNILSYIFNGLKDGYCTDIWFDAYYIPGKHAYQKQHLTHGVLVYGYNVERRVFLTMAYTENGFYEPLNVEPLHIVQACSNKYFEYACLIKRNMHQRPRYELATIKQKLVHYLHSNSFDLDNHSYYYGYPKPVFGLNACTALVDKIAEQPDDGYIGLRSVYCFCEHKKCMAWRIKTIAKLEKITWPELEDEIKQLNAASDIILNLCIKFNNTKNAASKKKVMNRIRSLVEQEKRLIERLLRDLN